MVSSTQEMSFDFPDVPTERFSWVSTGFEPDRWAWELIVRRWIRLVEEYSRAVIWQGEEKQDVPYWYGERTNVGILAAATWLAGFPTLEESKETKVDGEPYEGRYDLAICLAEGRSWSIEAKHDFLWLNRRAEADSAIKASEKAFNAAMNDARCCKEILGSRAGLAFLVPGIKEGIGGPEEFWLKLRSIVVRLEASGAVDVIAWVAPGLSSTEFAGQKERPWPENVLCDGYSYPGVLLVGGIVHDQ